MEKKHKEFSDIIGIEKGLTSFIGGGGKTSLIYKLGRDLDNLGNKVIITTTTKMYIPQSHEVDKVLIEPSLEEVKAGLRKANLLYLGGPVTNKKVGAIDKKILNDIRDLADYILVEADGAKELPIKLPGDNEPAIPLGTSHVVILVGLRSLNRPLNEVCFRYERALKILGVKENHILSVEDIFRLVFDNHGLVRDTGPYRRTLLLNQSDILSIEEETRLKNYFKEHSIIPTIVGSLQEERYEKLC